MILSIKMLPRRLVLGDGRRQTRLAFIGTLTYLGCIRDDRLLPR
jgi:hypothetical protein